MEVWLQKRVNGTLAPMDDMARETVRRLKIGAPILCDVRQPRNGAMHRKFWALITTVWQAAGNWDSPEDLLIELKVRLGIVRDVVIRSTGEIVKIPGSISYAKMDQQQFGQFYERALIELCEMAGGIESDALRQAVLEELAV